MRPASGGRIAYLLLALLLTAPGCAGRHGRMARPGPAPAGPGGWAPTLEEPSWGALYRGSLQGGGEARNFRMALAYENPDRFRLEFFGAIGGTRLLVASDGEVLSAALPGERVVGRGTAGPGALGALLGIPVPGRELVALLAGEPDGGIGGTGSRRSRALPGGGEIESVRRTDDRGRVEAVQVDVHQPGRPDASFQVEYGDYRDGPTGERPREIRLSRDGRSVILRLREAGPRSFPEGTFEVPVPEGFDLVALERLTAGGALLGGRG